MNYAHEMPALTAEDIVKSRLHLIVKDLFKEVLKRTTELIDAEKNFIKLIMRWNKSLLESTRKSRCINS